ncbi:hypothetical protein V6N13_092852 [Hibiscus sabdariffa]
MVDVLKRPGSEIPAGFQPLQKKVRTWEESIIIEDELMEMVGGDKLENEILPSRAGGRIDGHRSAEIPSFKDKLLGNPGKNGLDSGLGELVVELSRQSRNMDLMYRDGAHKRHLTNVERMHRHLSLSDVCSICLNGAEDIEHVLRKCPKAHDLWSKVLRPKVLDTFLATPFDAWFLGNLRFRSHQDHPDFDWCMRFSIFCWLLWKTRCCMLLDPSYVMHESILDRGNRLIEDCNKIFSRNKVQHVPREVNEIAKKLVAMRRGQSKEGRVLLVPPGTVAIIVDDEQCR